MRPKHFAVIYIAVLVSSCSGGSSSPTTPTPTAVTAPAPVPAPAPVTLNLAGTWTGTLLDTGRGTGTGGLTIRSWTASQTGASVTGPMVFDVGQGQVFNTTFSGTVSGSQLTAITFTVPAGSIAVLPTCSFSGTGTNAATATAISGVIAMTFAAPCVGNNLPSATTTGNWQITLAK